MFPSLSRALAVVASIVLVLTPASGASAQVGSTTDILTGVVTGPDAKPLAGAIVDATAVDGQITRHATTGAPSWLCQNIVAASGLKVHGLIIGLVSASVFPNAFLCDPG